MRYDTGMQKQRMVVMGGGTGTFTVLQGLAAYSDTLDLTAVVSMADSGGSTGRLRDAYGMLPVGDVRMALTALAHSDTPQQELLRKLLLYRFPRGEGLAGHNLGNLLLVALTDLLGSESAAIKALADVLSLQGTVLPVTEGTVTLCARYEDGAVVEGEHAIDVPADRMRDQHIVSLYLEGENTIAADAQAALAAADYIIVGPGDIYTSLAANAVVNGVAEAVAASPAQFWYISNVMTRPGQTVGMSAADHRAEITKYFTREPDRMFINDAPLPEAAVQYYQEHGTAPVVDDMADGPSVVRAPLVATTLIEQQGQDALSRSLIRHDSDALARVLYAQIAPTP